MAAAGSVNPREKEPLRAVPTSQDCQTQIESFAQYLTFLTIRLKIHSS